MTGLHICPLSWSREGDLLRVGAEAELCLTFASGDPARIQEADFAVLHIACSYLDHLFAEESVQEPGAP